mmetsp:Transcript_13711/g.20652  ORF Transcript_13711/g.20652 Transcript_13711/m.20652 type:complete len:715 (+) Transcript_13711:64-2208(+)|eukprot:scaffold41852_cov194-Skeletonema_dohrnii-CCMP3373.AAC.1
MSTETIAPKIIQRPAGSIQLQKRPVEEKVTSRRSDDASSAMKVLVKANDPPPPATNESCTTDLEKEEKKVDPSTTMSTAVMNSTDGTAADLSAASVEEWNPLEEVDSALLTALCDAKERKALVRLESILVDFMKDPSLTSIDVGGAFNSIVVGLRHQQTSENEPTGGGVTDEEDATTFVPSQSQGLHDLLNQYQRGVRQTSFQRLILHRLADRFNIVREQINNVNPNPTPAANSERNTSERGLVDVGVNNNNNWSPQQQQQQQNSYPLGLIRLIKKEESCTPPHLLINLDLSLLVNYKNPRARNFVPNNNNSNNNNAEEGMRTLSDNMNAASLDNAAGVTSMPGPKKPNKKMVIMKRNSSSNTSGSGEGGANGKREGRSRRKKLEDREKAYEEARARIFGKEEKKEAERISDEKGESAAIQESLSPLNSCHSSFSAEENNEAPPTDLESADVSNGSHIVPSQLISGTTPKIRSASPSPEPPGSAVPASQVETEGEQKQGQSKTKAVYRNRQQEENDPDFRRRSAYVPAAAMGVTPSGHMPPGVPYNMVNPYAVNPYSTVPGQHVMMQQQPPHFYPHPGQVTPQDPQSLHYPGYSQPRVFYPAQPQQPQSQPRSTEPPQVQPSVVSRKTNDSSQAVALRPENIAPQVNDARQPQTPSWGPNARLEVKSSEPAAPTNVATAKKATPAKITTPPAKNEKREIKTTTLYKDEDFPALG